MLRLSQHVSSLGNSFSASVGPQGPVCFLWAPIQTPVLLMKYPYGTGDVSMRGCQGPTETHWSNGYYDPLEALPGSLSYT